MNTFRIGHGYDIHRLQPGGQLVLGGIVVSTEISPIAHSDGDVVIHALIDALLGAMCLGDIGESFPDTNPKFKGIDSKVLLRETYEKIRNAKHYVVNVDITIMAERPRISPFKKQMVDSLESLLELKNAVNIKAGTNEGCDAVGRGEAIAAHAVVLLMSDG